MIDADRMFIDTLTSKTGITYSRIESVFRESGLIDQKEVCDLFMDKFQMSFGFANTLAEIILKD